MKCHTCKKDSIPGERYCWRCRAAVLATLAKWQEKQQAPREREEVKK